ncbi:ABC transporter ATP-binding protein [Pediococcus argentinicus]|uniref:ABC superfamily ATP binding cassette transporter, ABC protein n=1 Tax=Pediococcus argentinicus TaxID=480391 RepID=A0A0R2NIQ9_9LACO|nr:ABC transporter ATP-binding protein [Pediococcus argentinicus]KRO25653.1 ABC superfamily ATP binding cassette transporter, ABC protein [Pediococcus argentinicus]NKZ22009.1 ABC transporter ATP-binding protein [Pediococcus argentinicus]GEP19180.1 ABC transporter ATP-binding protein [Pediococcus argentinicus]
MTNNLVSVQNIAKSYDGKHPILKDINLELLAGQIVGLLGPSGAGKTTLVKCIMGMQSVDHGKIEVFDTPMPNRQVLGKIGYMAQSDALYDELTARENLIFFGNLLSVAKADLNKMIEHAAQVVNLTNDLDKPVSDYSGGMKRRLSVAIALLQSPHLLILDEPTVGIDPELRQQIWQELKQLKSENKSIIITTHVMEDAEQCDYLMLIRDGYAISQGTPSELKEKFGVDSIEEVFLSAGRDK